MPATEEVVLKVSGDARGGISALKQISSALNSLWADIKKLGGSNLGGLIGSFRSLSSSVSSLFGGMGKAVLGGILSPLNLARGAISPLKAAVGSLGGIFQTALGVVAGSAINTAISSLKQLAAEPVMVAARVGVLETVLNTVGATAGYTKEQLSGFVEGLKDTGISTKESLNNLVKMVQANLDLSKATELARVAQNAAVIAGENSSETFAAMIHGITTLNPLILRQRGIIVDIQGEIKKWAEANGVAASEVSASTKQQIAMNAVLAAGGTIAGAYESAMTQAGKKLGSLKRYIEEAQLALGRGLTPILSATVDITGNMLKKAQAFFESIQPALTAFSERVAAGLSVLYEKGQVAMAALSDAFARAKPYLVEIGQIIGHYLPQVGDRLRLLWVSLKGAIGDLVSAVSTHVPNMASLWTSFTDTVKGALESVLAILDGFRLLLAGRGEQAALSFNEAITNGLAVLIIIWEDYVSKALAWGYNLISSFASGIIQGASELITAAATYVGNLIGSFFASFSPPKAGPLAGILKWGQGLINTYFRGFATADFGLLKNVGDHIKQALQSAVKLGDLPEEELIPMFNKVREQAAGLIAHFRKTGEISETALSKISETLGTGSEDLVEYLRLQLEHQKALKDLTAVEEEVAAAEAKGFVPTELREKLNAAKARVDEAQDELSWQEELLKAQQETVDLQAEQANVMKKLTAAVDKLGGAMGKVSKALTKGAEDPWERFVKGYEEDMAVLEKKRDLGLISEEEYLKGLESLQSRYVDQAIRMGKPYETQLASLMKTREALKALGAKPGAVAAPEIGPIALPKIDASQMKVDVDAGIKEAFSGVSERFGEAKAKAKELMENFGLGIKEELSKLPGIIRGKLSEAFASLREIPAIDTVISAVSRVVELISATIGSVVDVLAETTWPKLQSAFATLSETLAQFGIQWSDVWRALVQATGIVLTILGALILGLVGIVVGVVNGIATALNWLVSSWQRAAGGAKKVIEGIAQAFAGASEIIKGLLEGDLPRAFNGLVNLFKGNAKVLVGLWEWITGAISMTVGTIVALVYGLVEGIYEFFVSLYNRLVGGSLIPELVERIVQLVQELYDRFLAKVEELVRSVLDKFTELKNQAISILQDFRDLAQGVIDTITGYFDTLLGSVESILEKLREFLGLETVFASFRDAIGELVDKVADFVSALADAAIPDWPFDLFDAFTGIKDALGIALERLGELLSGLAEAVLPDWLIPGSATPFELGLRGIASAMEDLSGLTDDWLASLDARLTLTAATGLATGTAGNTYQFYFGEGAFSGAFPNVREGEDARDFMQELNALIERASARAGIPGGIT